MNLLIALAWPSHVHHDAAQKWFTKRGAAAFRTCPLTQTGFVRVSSNPAFSRDAVSPRGAIELLKLITSMRGHEFWADDLSLVDAMRSRMVVGHRQITDAYLLALAAKHGGTLASLDRGLSVALSAGETVEVLDGR